MKTEVFSDGTYDNDNANTSFNDAQNNDSEKKDSEINDSQMMDDFQNNDSQSNDTGNNESVIHELLDDVKILILSPQEQIQEIEDRKTSSNYLNSSYKCSYCFKGFMMPSTFRNHMLKHDPVSIFLSFCSFIVKNSNYNLSKFGKKQSKPSSRKGIKENKIFFST